MFEISDHFIRVVLPFEEPEVICNTDSGTNHGTNGTHHGTNGDIALSEGEEQLLRYIRGNENVKQADCEKELGLSTRQVKRLFQSLKEKGVIERLGSSRTGRWLIVK